MRLSVVGSVIPPPSFWLLCFPPIGFLLDLSPSEEAKYYSQRESRLPIPTHYTYIPEARCFCWPPDESLPSSGPLLRVLRGISEHCPSKKPVSMKPKQVLIHMAVFSCLCPCQIGVQLLFFLVFLVQGSADLQESRINFEMFILIIILGTSTGMGVMSEQGQHKIQKKNIDTNPLLKKYSNRRNTRKYSKGQKPYGP